MPGTINIVANAAEDELGKELELGEELKLGEELELGAELDREGANGKQENEEL